MRLRPGIGLGAAVLLIAAASTGAAQASAAPNAAHGMHPQRVCAAASNATEAACDSEVMVPDTATASGKKVTPARKQPVPDSSTPPSTGRTPAQIRSAYNLNGTASGGKTVAVVDAYGYPELERDLGVYRSYYGLPACTTANGCLHVMNQTGGTSLPAFNAGWAGETALDVQAISATCPDCKIDVVEANSSSIANLGAAAATAAKQPGVAAISNSYGGGDLSDATYGSYYNHPGIAVTASTGDNGYQGASFPASSDYVTAVGGTTLAPASNARGWTETAWSGSGSGCSTVNAALAAAAPYNTGCSKRAMADVAAAADPNTGGLAVYFPSTKTSSTWTQVGGTSEASPIIASVYALSGNTAGYANSIPYSHSTSLYDITSGSNGTCSPTQWCQSGTGWDGPTGLGTPDGVSGF